MLDKVKIGWMEYKVKVVKSSEINNGDGEFYGRCNHGTNTIIINDSYSKEQREATLLHEVIHVVDNYAGLDLSERQVKGLANMLYQVIKGNNWRIK